MAGESSSAKGETEERTVPDGGWGWMVALGCYVMVVRMLDSLVGSVDILNIITKRKLESCGIVRVSNSAEDYSF